MICCELEQEMRLHYMLLGMSLLETLCISSFILRASLSLR